MHRRTTIGHAPDPGRAEREREEDEWQDRVELAIRVLLALRPNLPSDVIDELKRHIGE